MFEKPLKSDFHFFSGEDVVLRLLEDWLDERVFLTDIMCLGNFLSVPLAGAPVKSESFSNDPVKSSACFLHGSLWIRSVAKQDINIVKLQIFKALLDALDDVLSR